MPDLIDRIIEAEKRARGANAQLLRDAYAAVRQRDALKAELQALIDNAHMHPLVRDAATERARLAIANVR